jgi:hypothetical protein
MRERIIELIEATTTPHKRFKELEEWTGVPSDSWRKFVAGKQRATSEMIEGLGKKFPDCCEWLLTGAVKARWQKDPTKKPLPGELDLAVLDVDQSGHPGTEEEGVLNQFTPHQIAQVVEATLTQLSKKARTSGDKKD